jgi:hypothetical protein
MPLTDATSTANSQLATISRFCTQLVLRPDADEVRVHLAATFVEHHGDLWPLADPAATPQWIEAHVDGSTARRSAGRWRPSSSTAWRGFRGC